MAKIGYSWKLLGEIGGLAREKKAYWIVPLAIVLGVQLSGCAMVDGKSTASAPQSSPQAAGQAQGGGQEYEQLDTYFEFDDVLVPRELEYAQDESFFFETPRHRVGNLVFDGRVDNFSLVDFFIANMTKDGWNKLASYKAKKSTLIFEKPGKSCKISVLDESFTNTRVEILVVESREQDEL